MATAAFSVTVSAGTLRPVAHAGAVMPHAWTDGGVAVEADFTGGHLLVLAAAGCVLNDVYREARRLDVAVDGVRVRALGELDTSTWTSTGIEYDVDVASDASPERVAELLDVVDAVAEIPKALRVGTTVRRRPAR
jgi:uncharacterized OsmC-like protein